MTKEYIKIYRNDPKAFIIFFICFFIISGCFQSGKKRSSFGIVPEYKLENEQFFQWDRLKKQWFQNTYKNCLQEFNVKLNCDDCPVFFMRANLHFDENGILYNINIIKESYCQKKEVDKIRNCLKKGLLNSTGSKLKGIQIQSYLGNGLRC